MKDANWEIVSASKSSGWWNTYFDEVSDEQHNQNLTEQDLDPEEYCSIQEINPSFKHVAWLWAKDEYLDSLDEFAEVELVNKNGRVYPAILQGDGAYEIEQSDIEDML